MTLEIKENRYYVNREGKKRGPMRQDKRSSGPYVWWDDSRSYTKEGLRYQRNTDSADLIAEWTEPAEEPEWGEWGPWRIGWSDGIGTQDYMYRRINGVEEYRKRKPRPVTMLVDVIDGKPDLSTLRPVTE
jgi:hypothetical protein